MSGNHETDEPRLPQHPSAKEIAEFVRASRERQHLPPYIEGDGLTRLLDVLGVPSEARSP